MHRASACAGRVCGLRGANGKSPPLGVRGREGTRGRGKSKGPIGAGSEGAGIVTVMIGNRELGCGNDRARDACKHDLAVRSLHRDPARSLLASSLLPVVARARSIKRAQAQKRCERLDKGGTQTHPSAVAPKKAGDFALFFAKKDESMPMLGSENLVASSMNAFASAAPDQVHAKTADEIEQAGAGLEQAGKREARREAECSALAGPLVRRNSSRRDSDARRKRRAKNVDVDVNATQKTTANAANAANSYVGHELARAPLQLDSRAESEIVGSCPFWDSSRKQENLSSKTEEGVGR